MSKVVSFHTYKLNDGASVSDFLLSTEKLIKEYVSKQKGYVSFQLFKKGDIWADSVTFETPDDFNAFLETENQMNELAGNFASFLNFDTLTNNTYSVEKNYSNKDAVVSNAVWFITYKLNKGVSVKDFLLASEKTNKEVLSKQKGFISWKVLVDGDLWVDLVTWETQEDAKYAENCDNEREPDPVALKFYSFIDPESLTNQVFTVEKSF